MSWRIPDKVELSAFTESFPASNCTWAGLAGWSSNDDATCGTGEGASACGVIAADGFVAGASPCKSWRGCCGDGVFCASVMVAVTTAKRMNPICAGNRIRTFIVRSQVCLRAYFYVLD